MVRAQSNELKTDASKKFKPNIAIRIPSHDNLSPSKATNKIAFEDRSAGENCTTAEYEPSATRNGKGSASLPNPKAILKNTKAFTSNFLTTWSNQGIDHFEQKRKSEHLINSNRDRSSVQFGEILYKNLVKPHTGYQKTDYFKSTTMASQMYNKASQGDRLFKRRPVPNTRGLPQDPKNLLPKSTSPDARNLKSFLDKKSIFLPDSKDQDPTSPKIVGKLLLTRASQPELIQTKQLHSKSTYESLLQRNLTLRLTKTHSDQEFTFLIPPLTRIPHNHINSLALYTPCLQALITKNRLSRSHILSSALDLYSSTLSITDQDLKLPMTSSDKEKFLLKKLNDRYLRYFIDDEIEEHLLMLMNYYLEYRNRNNGSGGNCKIFWEFAFVFLVELFVWVDFFWDFERF